MKSKNVVGISILGLATAMLMSVGARAEERVENETPKLTGMLKYGVTQSKAEAICQDKGMRLPTARELALVSQSLGAQGISETEKDGYHLVKGSDSAGNPDHFYFSNEGYKRPSGDLGSHFFWSSSVHPDYTYNVYGLYGDDGDIYNFNHRDDIYYIAVRCVQ